MGTRTCPKCGAEMEYVETEPDVGIEGGVYQCTNDDCNEIMDPPQESDYMDDAARDEANHRSGS